MSPIRLGVAALVTVALTSCTAKEAPRDTARADSASAAATAADSLAAAPPQTAAQLGVLTKPIDQYTGDEFYAFVRRLTWGGGVEDTRKCRGSAGCDGPNPRDTTRVRIDAVDGQDPISPTAVPTNGVVAVRALNRGNFADSVYGFKPEGGKLEYYLIVLPGTGGNGQWRFEELDTTPGARRHVSLKTGTFTPCANHRPQPGRVNRVNFYRCEDSPDAGPVQRSNLMLFVKPTDPIWIDCAAGCCIVS